MANPKLDFLLNVPTVVTLGKNFKNGSGEYGPWFGWNATDNGVEKTLFADEDLQAKIAPFGTGATVAIIKSQIPGTRQFSWHVGPPNGAPTTFPSPPVQIPVVQPVQARQASGAPDRDTYRDERISRALEAIQDAERVMNPETWSREDVRALAISFLIDEQHKGIAPPEGGF